MVIMKRYTTKYSNSVQLTQQEIDDVLDGTGFEMCWRSNEIYSETENYIDNSMANVKLTSEMTETEDCEINTPDLRPGNLYIGAERTAEYSAGALCC